MAFSFYRRSDGQGVRLVFDRARLDQAGDDFAELNQKWLRGELEPDGEARLMEMRQERPRWFMTAPLEEMFTAKTPDFAMPRPARILTSLTCDQCGESVMESRTRRLEGRILCIACFEARDKLL